MPLLKTTKKTRVSSRKFRDWLARRTRVETKFLHSLSPGTDCSRFTNDEEWVRSSGQVRSGQVRSGQFTRQKIVSFYYLYFTY